MARLLILSCALATVIALAFCYRGAFYETGAQFYESCWNRARAGDKEASSAEQAARWASCSSITESTVYSAGYIFNNGLGKPRTEAMKAMNAACPNTWNMPIGGTWDYVVESIKNSGGPTLIERLEPASWTVMRVYRKQWPDCPQVARQNGIPRLTRGRDGDWVFSAPCKPCEAEKAAEAKYDAEENRKAKAWLDKFWKDAGGSANQAGASQKAEPSRATEKTLHQQAKQTPR